MFPSQVRRQRFLIEKNQVVSTTGREGIALRPRTAIELVNNKGGGVLCGEDSAKSTRFRNPATWG